MTEKITIKEMKNYLYRAGSINIWNTFTDILDSCEVTSAAYNWGLRQAWIMGRYYTVDEAAFLFMDADKKQIMTKNEQKQLEAMPEFVTLYRGTSIEEYEDSKEDAGLLGISWTTDRRIAEFFAFRNERQNRAVLQTTVAKEDISAYFLSREEFEAIVLFPTICAPDVYKPKLVTTQPTEYYHNYIEYRKKQTDRWLKRANKRLGIAS